MTKIFQEISDKYYCCEACGTPVNSSGVPLSNLYISEWYNKDNELNNPILTLGLCCQFDNEEDEKIIHEDWK